MKNCFEFAFLLLLFCFFTSAIKASGTNHFPKANDSEYLSDTTPPVVNCISGVVFVKLDTNLCITIKAKDFDRGSYDDITPPSKLRFYFNGNNLNDSIKICCTDFQMAQVHQEFPIDLEIWVADEANNAAYIKIIMIVLDNLNICSQGDPGGIINVQIKNESEDEIQNINVNLNLNGQLIALGQWETGGYKFKYLQNRVYQLCLSRNDNPLNGVSTADVIKIRRHILGLELLTSPFKQIAADVNLSKSITTADVSEIRRLILGLIPEFNEAPSWAFIDKDPLKLKQQGKPPSVGSQFCDTIEILNWNTIYREAIGVKIGDVNNTARVSDIYNYFEERDIHHNIEYEHILIGHNKILTVFSCNEKLSGLQFKLKFNSDDFQFEKFEIGELDIKSENVNLERLNLGELSVVWDGLDDEFNERNYPVLFKIIWKRKGTHHNQLNLSLIPYQIPPLIVDQSLNENYFSLEQVQGGNNNLTHEFIASYSNYELVLKSNKVISGRSNLSINDIAGNLLYTDKLLFESGELVKKINIVLNPGIYTICISGNGKNQILKLLVPR